MVDWAMNAEARTEANAETIRFAATALHCYGNLLAEDETVSVHDVVRYHAAAARLREIGAELHELRAENAYLRHVIQRAHVALSGSGAARILERAMETIYAP